MFSSTLLAAAAAFVALASAQNAPTDGLNYTTSGPLNVTISQIPLSTRNTWCIDQTATCLGVCDGRATQSCVAETLAWTCNCTSGTTPNISDYQQTIPGQICRVWQGNCIDAAAADNGDLSAERACMSVECGNKTVANSVTNPSGTTSTTTATSSGSSSTDTASQTSATAAATSTNAAVLAVAQNYGTGIMLTGLLAVFGLAL